MNITLKTVVYSAHLFPQASQSIVWAMGYLCVLRRLTVTGVKPHAQLVQMATFAHKNPSSILQNKVVLEGHIVLLVFNICVQLVLMDLWKEVVHKLKLARHAHQDITVLLALQTLHLHLAH